MTGAEWQSLGMFALLLMFFAFMSWNDKRK